MRPEPLLEIASQWGSRNDPQVSPVLLKRALELELTRFSGEIRTWQLRRLLESIPLLVFGRAQVAERPMQPLAIEEDLIIENGGRKLLARLPVSPIQQFNL